MVAGLTVALVLIPQSMAYAQCGGSVKMRNTDIGRSRGPGAGRMPDGCGSGGCRGSWFG
jgi:hypothetical protein